MKDIDIIKGIQFVGDDLISRAESCSPIRRRSVKGYIAAAACLLLVAAAVPLVIARMNHIGAFSTETNGIERLDADKYGRTFYNMLDQSEVDRVYSYYPPGTIRFSSALEKLLEYPHEDGDCFAVTVEDALGADLNTVHAKFTHKYDVNNIAKHDPVCPTIYVTEKQLRSMEPVEGMCLYIFPVKREADWEEFTRDDLESFKNERFTKFYGEIHLNYTEEDAIRTLGLNYEETSSHDPAVLAELERYYRDFAVDYGIDPDNIFAGGVTRTIYANIGVGSYDPDYEPKRVPVKDIVLHGEFETAVVEKMLRDKRVNAVCKTPLGSYIYEERGLWSYPTTVSAEKISMLPSGMTYGEIVEALGHTAQYGENSLHVYLAVQGEAQLVYEYGIIILDYDDPSESCPYSGDELLSNAVHLVDLADGYNLSVLLESRWHANAVILKDDLALVSYKNRIKPVRIGFGNVITNEIFGFDPHYDENGEINWYDQRHADKSEVFRPGTRLAVTRLNSLDNFEANYDSVFPFEFACKRIVIIPENYSIDNFHLIIDY